MDSLRVEGISAGYGQLKVLHDVSLHVGEHEVVGLLGANGAGKTTLVRTISGLIRPLSGRVLREQHDLTRLPAYTLPARGVAVVLETRNLFGELSVKENLMLAWRGRRKGTPDKFTVDEVLRLFPVLGEKFVVPCSLLSGGQQQMVAIARALLLQPDVLVLDEPSTGLAPKIIKDIVDVLQQLRAKGISMLLVEQNVGMASELTDRAYVLSLGRVVHEVAKGDWKRTLEDNRIADVYLGASEVKT